jgi:endonuclease YncB( thermonuclease family)
LIQGILVAFFVINAQAIPQSFANSNVSYVYDGDTLTLQNGKKVRLVQIDTPELSPAECYGIQARDLLRKMVGTSTIKLRKEPASPNKGSTKESVVNMQVNYLRQPSLLKRIKLVFGEYAQIQN